MEVLAASEEEKKMPESPKGGRRKPADAPVAPTIVVRPVARPAKVQNRHRFLALSFVMCVLLPTLLIGVYMGAIARDQYFSRVSFSVRSVQSAPAIELLGGISNLTGADTLDSDILYDFLKSQQLVEEIDEELGLRHYYVCPDDAFDPLYCLRPEASVEELVTYWNNMTEIAYDGGGGIIELSVRAFAPQDAKTIAEVAFKSSGRMINDLSNAARSDATKYAEIDLERSVDRLKLARRRLAEFRNETQIIDPDLDFQSQMGVITSLQEQLTSSLIDRGLLELTTSRPDPRLDRLDGTIQVIEEQIELQRGKFGHVEGSQTEAYAEMMGQFEELNVEVQFAEQAYIQSLANLDAAQAEAQKQSRYLAAHVRPTLAQTAEAPKGLMITGLTLFFAFFIWLVGVLIYYSLRERV
ncbi:MAG: hypothetical protein HWE33_05645 [Rhodobacteraceae bacterium]|uniref:hypothetical protein n=1 Tax=Celeribacter sp. HF31 TaxID=2721558 RepID=UPI00143130B9|nr:hypothetical protein [Celeribacter sp. HF31]NIY79288.1 hypothetical protein [Celeribacter sp. HF31]NVK45772.1 hypothetical protein [Paracoccaceae bacterium]